MAQQSKSTWLALFLVVAAGVILVLTLAQPKPKTQGVTLQDVLQQPAAAVTQQDPVSSPAIVEDSDIGKQTGFAVQVYSFQDKNRAAAAISALKESGYQSYLIISDLGEKGVWYRVRVGGFQDEPSAQKVLEQIRRNYNSGFIVKPEAIKK